MILIVVIIAIILRIDATNQTERLLADNYPPPFSYFVRGPLGPFRLKFVYVSGDYLGYYNGVNSLYPDPALYPLFDGVAQYLFKALNVYQIISPISVLSCEGYMIEPTLDTDFIIIVKNENYYYSIGGTTCYNEPDGRNNAAAGVIRLSQNFYNLSPKLQYIMILKRVFKVLGFSESQSYYWRTFEGGLYNNLIKTEELRGSTRRILTTPKVIEKTFEAFGYSPDGIELENNFDTFLFEGAPDTWYWEGRILPYEILSIPDISQNTNIVFNPYVSTITLAMLEDSGWYYPNYEFAQVPLINRGAGREWFEVDCPGQDDSRYADPFSNPDESNPGFFCNALGTSVSSIYSYYPSTYSLSDNCYFPLDIINCYSDEGGSSNIYKHSFEVFSHNSRCFSGLISSSYASFCLEVVSCVENIITFKVESSLYVCNYEGENLNIIEIDATVICPNKDAVCKETSCINMCWGNGYCKNSKCECFDGYFGSDCSLKCQPGCKKCTVESLECTECLPGFYLDWSYCFACDPRCKTCKSSFECESCTKGYYLDGNECTQCDPKCKDCFSKTECTECAPNYYLQTFTCCQSGCLNCNNEECLICDYYLILYLGRCILCIPGCSFCYMGTFSNCDRGYYKDGYQWKQCDISCSSCENSLTCSACNNGYFYIGDGKCITCPDRCTTCYQGECKGCKENYYLVSNICCPIGCETCNLEKCFTCGSEYLLTDNGLCVPCSTGCNHCDIFGCLSCKVGYYQDEKNCIKCDISCLSCENLNSCTRCNDNYISFEGGICKACPNSCKECSEGECKSCKENSKFVGNICCPIGCTSCDFEKCLGCDYELFMDSGKCIKCPDYCQKCENGVCVDCKNGFFIDTNLCKKCDISCLTCDSLENCKLCSNGYLSTKDGKCIICPASCSECSGGVCKGCKDNFYLTENFCCPISCKTCDLEKCLTCPYDHLYVAGQCIPCPDECGICTDGICDGCGIGFFKFDSVCYHCINNCDKCSNELTCMKCSLGFFKNSDNICVLRTDCPQGCNLCTESICLECNSGHYLSSGICNKCAPGCLFCTSLWECTICSKLYTMVNKACCDKRCQSCTPFECKTCKRDFLLNDGKCENCPMKCKSCRNNICQSCKEKYYLSGAACLDCPIDCKTCKFNVEKVVCTSCYVGFKLRSGVCIK